LPDSTTASDSTLRQSNDGIDGVNAGPVQGGTGSNFDLVPWRDYTLSNNDAWDDSIYWGNEDYFEAVNAIQAQGNNTVPERALYDYSDYTYTTYNSFEEVGIVPQVNESQVIGPGDVVPQVEVGDATYVGDRNTESVDVSNDTRIETYPDDTEHLQAEPAGESLESTTNQDSNEYDQARINDRKSTDLSKRGKAGNLLLVSVPGGSVPLSVIDHWRPGTVLLFRTFSITIPLGLRSDGVNSDRGMILTAFRNAVVAWNNENVGITFAFAEAGQTADIEMRFSTEQPGEAFFSAFFPKDTSKVNPTGVVNVHPQSLIGEPTQAVYNAIMTHELGHVLGLRHNNRIDSASDEANVVNFPPTDAGSIMSPRIGADQFITTNDASLIRTIALEQWVLPAPYFFLAKRDL
jgi:hypothetical protein